MKVIKEGNTKFQDLLSKPSEEQKEEGKEEQKEESSAEEKPVEES